VTDPRETPGRCVALTPLRPRHGSEEVARGIPYYGIEPRVKRTGGDGSMLAADNRHSQGIDASLSAAVAGYVVVTLGCSIAFWTGPRLLRSDALAPVGGARDLAWQRSEGACRVLT
jgi:hypothetical protein